MDWFKELYDDFRMRTGFGSIPDAVTAEQVDFLVAELRLYDGAKHTIENKSSSLLHINKTR